MGSQQVRGRMITMRGLNGKRVIVTGGASGIGREVCKRFAEEGSDVAVFEVNAAGAAETTKLIKNAGGKANSIRAYITDSAAVDAAAAELESVGRLMFSSTMRAGTRYVLSSSPVLIFGTRSSISTSMDRCTCVTLCFLERSRNGRRRVVNISSDAGRVASSGEAVCSACKGDIIAFTKTTARELARNEVRLNAVRRGRPTRRFSPKL